MKVEKRLIVPVPSPPPFEYVITLSHDQAVHLIDVLSNIGAGDEVHGEFAPEWKTLCELNTALSSVELDKFCGPTRMQSMYLRKL